MSIPTVNLFGIDVVSLGVAFGIFFCAYLIISLSLNMEFGYTGIPNFGKVLFVAAGGLLGGSLAYRLALYFYVSGATNIFGEQFRYIPVINSALASAPLASLGIFLFTIVVGAGLAAVFGFLASYPAIRLREDYLGMLLLASGEFFAIFLRSYSPVMGGTQPLALPDPLFWAVATRGLRNVLVLGVMGLFALLVFLYVQRVGRSPLGRTLRAVRDNEVAAAALGKDNVAIRRKVLVISSALSGIAGALWILYTESIIADPLQGTFTRLDFTFIPFLIVILGGAANNYGVALGTAVFVGLTEAISEFQTYVLAANIKLPISVALFNDVIASLQYLLVGVLLIVMLLWRPEGLIREKPTVTMPKKQLAAMSVKGPVDEETEKEAEEA